jgi:hypothetical protein
MITAVWPFVVCVLVATRVTMVSLSISNLLLSPWGSLGPEGAQAVVLPPAPRLFHLVPRLLIKLRARHLVGIGARIPARAHGTIRAAVASGGLRLLQGRAQGEDASAHRHTQHGLAYLLLGGYILLLILSASQDGTGPLGKLIVLYAVVWVIELCTLWRQTERANQRIEDEIVWALHAEKG